MPLNSTHYAINFITNTAFKLLILFIPIPFKYEFSIWGWTVVENLIILLKKKFQLKFLQFFIKIFTTEELKFSVQKFNSSFRIWAGQRESFLFNLGLNMHLHTSWMKNMLSANSNNFFKFYCIIADFSLRFIFLLFFFPFLLQFFFHF